MKKVLIITYYWPPAGGPGVQRWLKFSKYLPYYNIKPIVYCPKNANYPIIDTSLVAEAATIQTIKQPINEPYRWLNFFSIKKSKQLAKGIIPEPKNQNFITKLLLYIRGNFFIPDARKFWVSPSVKFLKKYIKEESIDTIITTGPPHSVHLIGLELAETFTLNWIADFRDPWTTIGYHKQLKLGRLAQLKHKMLERKVLTNATKIIVTSALTKSEFELYTPKPIHVITNGYDFTPKTDVSLGSKFTVSHIGSLLSKRNPELLWAVLSELCEEDESFDNDFELKLVGEVSEAVLTALKKYNLISNTSLLGYVSHQEAIALQQQSQLLLLIEIDSKDTQLIIPGKLFEYIASLRPILAIGPEISDVKRILNETSSGQYFTYDEKSLLKMAITDYYKAFKVGTLTSNTTNYEQYSRKALTKQLSNLI